MLERDGHPRDHAQALSVGFSNRSSAFEVRISHRVDEFNMLMCSGARTLFGLRVSAVIGAALFPTDSSNLFSSVLGV